MTGLGYAGMEPAAPPFSQPELLNLFAAKRGTVHKDGALNAQQTAIALGRNDRRIRRALGIDPSGNATLRWDETWRIFTTLGWINETAVRRDLRRLRLNAARREAEAAERKTRGVRKRRSRGS